jgi:hypothetical protein
MKKRAIRCCCGAAGVVLFCFVSGAFATSVPVTVTALNADHTDGYDVGPDSATVNGVAKTQVISDDFSDKTKIGKTNTDTVNTFSSLGSTLWGAYYLKKGDKMSQITKMYDEAAWLTLQLLNPANSKAIGDIQFAIWALFNAKALKKDPNAQSWLTLAGKQSYYSGEFSNFLILTPTCSNGPGTCSGQEFFEIVPEGGTALMYLLLAGASCFAALFHSSRRANHWRVRPRLAHTLQHEQPAERLSTWN